MRIINLAIFISGHGSNALNIIEYFEKNKTITVSLVLSNNSDSNALEKAKEKGIEVVVFNNESFKNDGGLLPFLKSKNIHFIVLAGFLRLIPKDVINNYSNKIINIHPALLPKYGGKGMYGRHVHLAVLENNEKESGITIHFVNEAYDDGQILFQKKVVIDSNDTLEDLRKKIRRLEHTHYPKIIEKVIGRVFFQKNN